jgi:excisionase family DNA binding protein
MKTANEFWPTCGSETYPVHLVCRGCWSAAGDAAQEANLPAKDRPCCCVLGQIKDGGWPGGRFAEASGQNCVAVCGGSRSLTVMAANEQPHETSIAAAPLLDASAAGRLLSVPASWVLAEARADRIPHVRLGRYVRFSAEELEEWWRSRMRGPRRTRGGSSTARLRLAERRGDEGTHRET